MKIVLKIKGEDLKKKLNIRDGEDGKTPSIAEIAKVISETLTPLIPKKEEIVKELSSTDVRDKLETLKDEERLDKSTIKGIEDIEKDIINLKARPSGEGWSRRVFQPKRDDLSSFTDGSTKIFYLSKAPIEDNVIMVFGTDFPTILRPTIDFTIANKTLTLTSAVPAPSLGATLVATYFT